MATDFPRSVRHFLNDQVLRSDYLIVDERIRFHTRLPYELKLERMHSLCIANGYRDALQCEHVRRELYTREDHSGRPVTLRLVESYLPHCLVRAPLDRREQSSVCKALLQLLASSLPGDPASYRQSQLHWGNDRFLMCLPADVHALLIDNDGALMAA